MKIFLLSTLKILRHLLKGCFSPSSIILWNKSSYGTLVRTKFPNSVLQICPRGWLDIKLKHLVGLLLLWWCNCSIQCSFIYQFTVITSIRSKSIYVLLLQVQHSSAHPLSPSRTDVSKQVWLNRNCCMSVAGIPWTLTSKEVRKSVCQSEKDSGHTLHTVAPFFSFFFFFP